MVRVQWKDKVDIFTFEDQRNNIFFTLKCFEHILEQCVLLIFHYSHKRNEKKNEK